MHTLLVVLAAFIFRANLIIPFLLQLISTPPIFFALIAVTYTAGNYATCLLGGRNACTAMHSCNIDAETLMTIFSSWKNFYTMASSITRAIAAMTLGALLLGFLCAGISILLFEIFRRKNK
jgi:uncharacterized protein (DUF2062 family)